MDLGNQSEFNLFMVRALASTDDDCYIELYNLLLRYCTYFFFKAPVQSSPQVLYIHTSSIRLLYNLLLGTVQPSPQVPYTLFLTGTVHPSPQVLYIPSPHLYGYIFTGCSTNFVRIGVATYMYC